MTSPTSPSSFSSTSPTLLGKLVAKDAAAWGVFVDVYGPLVAYWIRRNHVSEADAADVLQEILKGLVSSLHRFEHRHVGSFRAFLWVLTRNQLARYFRSKSQREAAAGGTDAWLRMATVAEALSEDPDPQTGPGQLNELTQRAIRAVQAEFEPRTWQMFWQTVVNLRPTSEVATEFGVHTAAVRQARSRVLRKLREFLG
ncbi:MAG: sigma-70 family RNA polymerase sigma factor [Planctomyces sp.]|nr:sigma-70 family RNA polymerase sigma factor [Planctomyces sp.]